MEYSFTTATGIETFPIKTFRHGRRVFRKKSMHDEVPLYSIAEVNSAIARDSHLT
jgi:hypothetical protein